MRITFLGAAGEVTGSSCLVESDGFRVLVDFGLFQGEGEWERNAEMPEVLAGGLDALVLTHAHLDHTGRVPLLVGKGLLKGEIFATAPTCELVEVLWRDTAKLMREEAEWRTRKNLRAGKPPVEPLYGDAEIDKALSRLRPVKYDEEVELRPGMRVRFRDAGHILGSSVVELWGGDLKVVFSGDLGTLRNVMEGRPSRVEGADFVVIESTYGSRRQKGLEETRKEFEGVISRAVAEGGKILVPTFVVDRAQRVLYELLLLRERGLLPAGLSVYFDSPMGKRVTDIYRKYSGLLSGEVQSFMLQGKDPFALPNLRYVESVDDSRAINEVSRALVMAGSGMCTGGRIVHHLRHNLWKSSTHIVFVGYQGRGTLGRRIVEGASSVRIMGEEVVVRAKVHTINGFSAHADSEELLDWASGFSGSPIFFVVHGESDSASALARSLGERFGFKSIVPSPLQSFDLEELKAAEILPTPARAFDEREKVKRLLEEIKSSFDRLASVPDLEALNPSMPLLEAARTILKTVEERTGQRPV